jgi:hypothetical protein
MWKLGRPEVEMARVDYWDFAWYQDIPGGGGTIGLQLTGYGGAGTVVGLTAYPVGQNGPVLAVENESAVWDTFYFDLVNVGPEDSVVNGSNLAFSVISA